MDATNPLLPRVAGLSVANTSSGAELVASWAPGARVVKAFDTVGYNIIEDSSFSQGAAVLFYCGDDTGAKQAVAPLITELGFNAMDAGSLQQSRLLEPFALLWIKLALQQRLGRDIAFQLMQR